MRSSAPLHFFSISENVYTEKQSVGQLIIDFSAKLKTRVVYLMAHELSELHEPGLLISLFYQSFPMSLPSSLVLPHALIILGGGNFFIEVRALCTSTALIPKGLGAAMYT